MRSAQLKEFLEQIKRADLAVDQAFTEILRISEVALALSDKDLARELRLSRPTVNRWRSGKSIPHVLMRKGVIEFLEKKARSQLKTAVAYESGSGGFGGGSQGTPPTPKVASPRY